jgi:cyclohexadienyl dehydratase
VHPEKPFNVAEKAYWLRRGAPLAAFVDRWLQTVRDNGRLKQIYAAWFE